jgi:hypothetical protein
MCTGEKQTPVDPNWVVLYDGRSLDLVVFMVPPSLWAALGVPKLSIRPVRRRDVVRVYGHNPMGEAVMSCGAVLDKADDPLSFSHSASTNAGDSGSPLFCGNEVVGVHVGGNIKSGKNIAVALVTLIPFSPESSDYDRDELFRLDTEFLTHEDHRAIRHARKLDEYEEDLDRGDDAFDGLISYGGQVFNRRSLGLPPPREAYVSKNTHWDDLDDLSDDEFEDSLRRLEAHVEPLQQVPGLAHPGNSASTTTRSVSKATRHVTVPPRVRAAPELEAAYRLAELEAKRRAMDLEIERARQDVVVADSKLDFDPPRESQAPGVHKSCPLPSSNLDASSGVSPNLPSPVASASPPADGVTQSKKRRLRQKAKLDALTARVGGSV